MVAVLSHDLGVLGGQGHRAVFDLVLKFMHDKNVQNENLKVRNKGSALQFHLCPQNY